MTVPLKDTDLIATASNRGLDAMTVNEPMSHTNLDLPLGIALSHICMPPDVDMAAAV